MSSEGSHNTTSNRDKHETAQSPSNVIVETLASPERKAVNIKGVVAQEKNTMMEAIEISSSHNEFANAGGKNNELRQKEVIVPAERILNKCGFEQYDLLNSEIEKMHEVVTNLQKMATAQQPVMPMMPYFQPMPSQFFNSMGGFNPNSPPFPSRSMPTMAFSPFTSPFRNPNPFPNQVMKDSIMKRLGTPNIKKASYDPKKSVLCVRRTDSKVSKAQAFKRGHYKQFIAEETQPTDIAMSLLNNPSPTGYYINQRDLGSSKLKPRNLGVEPPFWLSVLFAPPTNMGLEDTEIMVATYIFGTDKDNEFARYLSLTNFTVYQVFLLMGIRHEHSCIEQMILSWTVSPIKIIEDYKEAFMGYVEGLRKIYVPVNEDNLHWYLLVFDMNDRQVILLDSNPDPRKKSRKLFNIKHLVDDGTRMRIAIDLIMKSYNLKKNTIIKVAKKNYKKIEDKTKNLVKK
ncbi:hypothetical protein PIB30_075462 [Stylosanthes scabra]|uniref:Ubiquitin-like protease family profile domain-containing protein n=1 Tax=Stylosanthes scabra TaxID=79078 RepID=A0ABU6TPK4_9FABA|nr:hypothetical protein [Stylosanthes scabra]